MEKWNLDRVIRNIFPKLSVKYDMETFFFFNGIYIVKYYF